MLKKSSKVDLYLKARLMMPLFGQRSRTTSKLLE
jgi:hypothetical protein